MLIEEPTTPLGEFDCTELTRRTLAVAEGEWFRDVRRQQSYDVHAQTQSLILLFCDGWPEMTIYEGPASSLLGDIVHPVMERILASRYPHGGTILRSMITRLPPATRITRHRDTHPSFSAAHRIHLPLVTNPEVEFIVGEERVPPRPHFAFELNNALPHQVVNRGRSHRIHLIFDYAPPSAY